jgi:hypothetical protein
MDLTAAQKNAAQAGGRLDLVRGQRVKTNTVLNYSVGSNSE